jgi:tetratricopeptide (TPR) repeat protein
MNLSYCFTKWVPGAFIFVMIIASACTSAQQIEQQPEPVAAPQATEKEAGSSPQGNSEPTDSDVMFHVLAGETLGAEGDLAGAAAEYLKAALLSDDPKIAERAAKVAVSAGEWQLVALASDRWAVLKPESLDARRLAAGSRLREGDYAGAEFQLAQILELTKIDQALGWSIVANLLAPANDQARANKVLNNLLRDFDAGSNVDALYARSQLAARTGQMDVAADLVQMAIDIEPRRVEFLAWSGRLAINRQAYELATLRYRQAWEIDTDDPNVAMAYAELLKHNNDLVTAQAVLAEVPDTPGMRFARVVFTLGVKDKQTAEALYQGFKEADYPNQSEAAFQAGQCAELLGHPRQAIDWYTQVSGERELTALLRQTFLLADLGEMNEAQNILTKIRMQGDERATSQSYQAEAQIYQEAGRPQEALQTLNTALELRPGDAALRYNRALLAVGMGQLELAESDLRLIIDRDPNNAAALNALGYTLVDLTDRYAEAEPLILRAYRLEPQETSIIDSMGWLAYRLGRLQEAEKFLGQAWAMSKNPEIAAHLGEVLWAGGQQEGARRVWRSGLQLDKDNQVLLETMKRFGVSP